MSIALATIVADYFLAHQNVAEPKGSEMCELCTQIKMSKVIVDEGTNRLISSLTSRHATPSLKILAAGYCRLHQMDEGHECDLCKKTTTLIQKTEAQITRR